MNLCKLEIVFKFAEVHGSFMTVKINDTVLSGVNNEVQCYEKLITLPDSVTLEFSGKNQTTDTILDGDQNIIKDKHILIKEIRLDNMPVERLYLERRLKLEHDNKVVYSNYIGFNGKMVIQFNKPDVFRQLLEWQRLGKD